VDADRSGQIGEGLEFDDLPLVVAFDHLAEGDEILAHDQGEIPQSHFAVEQVDEGVVGLRRRRLS
jgi:hypothetical protein